MIRRRDHLRLTTQKLALRKRRAMFAIVSVALGVIVVVTADSLFEGVREMLGELLDRGFVLGIATGKTRRGLARALAQHGLAHHFAASRCADEGLPKPHPDMLHALMGQAGVEPEETLMIGDTTHDLALARNAGVAAVAVAYGAHASEGLVEMAPLATVHSIAELRAWLEANA